MNTKNTGMGFIGWLTLLFIGLKLTGNIAWSWWWVLAPVWLPIAALIAVMCVLAIAKFVTRSA